jgi:hypothetical protein
MDPIKKNHFFSVTKHWYMWLRVNLTRSHITKQRFNPSRPWNTCLRQKGKINIKLIPSS